MTSWFTDNLLLCLGCLWILTGFLVLFFCPAPHLQGSAINVLYLLVQVVTTIGYGDLTPVKPGMKLFLGLYILGGCILFATAISEFLDGMIQSTKVIARKRLVRRWEGELEKHTLIGISRLGVAGLIALCFLLAGTIFYGYFSNCICPDTECNFHDCEATGGTRRTMIDAFYMSCITLTTVGFGDEAPVSPKGRIFGIPWMLLGVTSTTNFISEIAHWQFLRKVEKKMAKEIVHKSLFDKIDKGHSGKLNKFEYVTYCLVKHGFVDEEDLDIILKQFEKLDIDGNEYLTHAEILQAHG